jgi:hypothetical protein
MDGYCFTWFSYDDQREITSCHSNYSQGSEIGKAISGADQRVKRFSK